MYEASDDGRLMLNYNRKSAGAEKPKKNPATAFYAQCSLYWLLNMRVEVVVMNWYRGIAFRSRELDDSLLSWDIYHYNQVHWGNGGPLVNS